MAQPYQTVLKRIYLIVAVFCATTLFVLTSTAAAHGVTPEPSLTTNTLISGLDHPWGLAFLPDNEGILITERPGRLRLWQDDAGLSEPIQGVPEVYAQGQGGLLDIALHPD